MLPVQGREELRDVGSKGAVTSFEHDGHELRVT